MTLKRQDVHLPALITAVLTLLVYLLTLEPDLTWANFGGDGGELITAAFTLGIPHPPGYPTYVLIGNLFGRLPIGTVAFRFHLLSALATAVASGFLTASVYHLLTPGQFPLCVSAPLRLCVKKIFSRNSIVAISAGLTFAFGSLVWGQATIAEVYPLNLALISAFLYTLISSSKTRPHLNGLLLGLAVTTHLTSLLLLTLTLLLTPRQNWLKLTTAFLLGLLPFLFLPWLAQSGSPVIWGQPDSLKSWWWLVSAQLYRPNVFGLPTADWPERLSLWGLPFLAQFAYIGLLPLVIGLLTLFKTKQRLLLGVFATALIYIFYAFTYNTIDAAVLLLPALLLLSVILGFGLHHIGKAGIILPFLLLWLNLGQVENGYYVNQTVVAETVEGTAVRPAAERLLNDLPTGAIVLTSGDPTIAALWYFHEVEGKRPDLIIIDGNLFQFEWYREQLGQTYPFLEHLSEDDLPGFKALNGRTRPFCETSLVQPGYLRC